MKVTIVATHSEAFFKLMPSYKACPELGLVNGKIEGTYLIF
jgi:hypothetical protein